MAAKKGGLGKGLDSLITNKVGISIAEKEKKAEADKDIVFIRTSKIEPNRNQPRKNFNEDALLELSESIKQYGVLQPLLVQDKKEYYEIIAGERRWRAAKIAGLAEIPVIIKKLNDKEMVEISLIENIQRENLNPIEEAQAFKRLLEEFHLKQDEVAERVSKSRTAVTNSMRLLKLDERVQQMLMDDMISTGHARALLAEDDKEKQFILAQKVFDEKLSVRETEKLLKKIQSQTESLPKKKEEDKMKIFYEDMEQKLKSIIGTKVSIHTKDKNKGKIEIEYYSSDELERIIDLFQSIHKKDDFMD